ncbi:MAG: 40S ribosomal protein S16 [Paramarteilia canceri]
MAADVSAQQKSVLARPLVQVHGAKGTAKAIALVRQKPKGAISGTIRINKKPLAYYVNSNMILKFNDALLAIGPKYLNMVNIDINAHGGGTVSKIYAIRQALCKGIVAYIGKHVDEDSMSKLKDKLMSLDKQMLIRDSRRIRPKLFGGPGATARYRKSYR